MMAYAFRLSLLAVFLSTLAACGFHLRGSGVGIPYKTLYVAGADQTILNDLRRTIRGSANTQLVDDPKAAEAVLQILSETREKRILSLTNAGRVREFQLVYTVGFSLSAGGKELIPPEMMVLRRDYLYDENQILAKENEEAVLNRDMQRDAVQQILRRINAVANTAK